jgi:hypothetical protein
MVKPSTYEYVNVHNGVPVHKIMETEPLPGEVFRNYPKKEIIEVSNLGRIKIKNEIIEQWDDDSNGKGWLYIKIGKIPPPLEKLRTQTPLLVTNDDSGVYIPVAVKILNRL